MPTINKIPKKNRNNQRNEHTEERVLRQKLYNTTKWRKLRQYHIQREPLCQECLREGKVYAGSAEDPLQVHHKRSPFKNGEINWELALDDNNLETICGYHHAMEHQRLNGYKDPQVVLDALEELFKEVDDENG